MCVCVHGKVPEKIKRSAPDLCPLGMCSMTEPHLSLALPYCTPRHPGYFLESEKELASTQQSNSPRKKDKPSVILIWSGFRELGAGRQEYRRGGPYPLHPPPKEPAMTLLTSHIDTLQPLLLTSRVLKATSSVMSKTQLSGDYLTAGVSTDCRHLPCKGMESGGSVAHT